MLAPAAFHVCKTPLAHRLHDALVPGRVRIGACAFPKQGGAASPDPVCTGRRRRVEEGLCCFRMLHVIESMLKKKPNCWLDGPGIPDQTPDARCQTPDARRVVMCCWVHGSSQQTTCRTEILILILNLEKG